MIGDYLCPKCRHFLNVGENVVFHAKASHRREGLIILHPQVGNYQVVKHPSFEYEMGEKVEFYCPYCNTKLTSERNDNLVKILMVDEKRQEYELLFSRIAGEKSTYVIMNSTMETFGQDSGKYFDTLKK
jgi:uncharacterized protein YbaR (Trm112 family)